MIRLVRLGQARELAAGRPVEFAAVHDNAAHLKRVAVHVLGGGVRHYVCAELKRFAQYGRGERVVHYQRYAVRVRRRGKALYVQYAQRGIGYRLAEHQLCVGLEGAVKLLVGCVGRHVYALYAQLLERKREQVNRAAINLRHAYQAVARLAYVEHRHEVRGLSGRGAHCAHAALQRRDLVLDRHYRGVCKARVYK